MSTFIKQTPSDDSADFWGVPQRSRTFWKWSHIGQTLEGKVVARTTHRFNDDDNPVPQLDIETVDGLVTLSVSQIDLKIKMAEANVGRNDVIKVTYLGEERATKGVRKLFKLELLGRATSAA